MSDSIRDEMEAAFTALDDSSPSTSDSTPEPAAPEAAATPEPIADVATPPSDTGATPVETPKGPIPYDRHQAVLTNVRKEYEWLQKYGNAETARQRLAVTEWMERDPVGFLRTYAANQGIDPSALFPQQQAPAAPAPPPVDEKPQPDVPLENGSWVYSDQRMHELMSWQQRQMKREFEQEIAPLKQEYVVAKIGKEADTKAQAAIQQARQTLPAFSEYEKDMANVMAAAAKQGYNMSLHEAYAAVVPAKLQERIQAAETQGYQKALTEFQQKAGAASLPTPRTLGGAPRDTSGMTIRELLEDAARG